MFFFNDSATTEIYTLSLHDALPIFKLVAVDETMTKSAAEQRCIVRMDGALQDCPLSARGCIDRKSTRLNSSHSSISYAVFCLKKKNVDCINNIAHFRNVTYFLL